MAGEGLLQRYLFAVAKEHNIIARKMAAVGRRGFPDVMLAAGGKIIFAELKNPNGRGRLSKLQEREIALMRRVGLEVRVIDSKEGVDDVIREFKTT